MLDGSVFLEMLEHPRKRIFDPVIADVQPTDATHLGDQRRYHVRTYRQAGAETLKPPPIQKYSQKKLTGKQ